MFIEEVDMVKECRWDESRKNTENHSEDSEAKADHMLSERELNCLGHSASKEDDEILHHENWRLDEPEDGVVEDIWERVEWFLVKFSAGERVEHLHEDESVEEHGKSDDIAWVVLLGYLRLDYICMFIISWKWQIHGRRQNKENNV